MREINHAPLLYNGGMRGRFVAIRRVAVRTIMRVRAVEPRFIYLRERFAVRDGSPHRAFIADERRVAEGQAHGFSGTEVIQPVFALGQIARAGIKLERAVFERAVRAENNGPARRDERVNSRGFCVGKLYAVRQHERFEGRKIVARLDDFEIDMRLEQHLMQPFVGMAVAAKIDAQRRRALRGIAPRFDGLQRAVGMADDAVGFHIHFAARRHLIADAAFCAVRRHEQHLVFERVRVFIAAEFTPFGVEFTCHAQVFLILIAAHEACARRHLVVAAPGGGQVFHFVMRLPGMIFGAVNLRTAGVEKQRRVRMLFVQDFVASGHEAQVAAAIVFFRIGAVFRIKPFRAHPLEAIGTIADVIQIDDIVKQAVQMLVTVDDFARKRVDMLGVIAAGAEQMPRAERTRIVRRGVRVDVAHANGAVFIPHAPFGVGFRIQRGKADGDIHRRGYADFVRCVHHCARQVETGGHRRMRRTDFRRVIANAVMTFGEDCDRVQIALAQRLLELRFVELRAHAGN